MKPPGMSTPTATPIGSPAVLVPSLKGKVHRPQRTFLYGPAGVGKSTLASLARDPLYLDTDRESDELDVRRHTVLSWAELRAYAQRPGEYGTLVIDNASKAEIMCVKHTLENVPVEAKGSSTTATSIESYGWGKGYRHTYDTWLLLLADLDRVTEAGHDVILIGHEITETVPNPGGEDFIRYEPRLQRQKAGSILSRTVEWADHVLYIGYDVVAKDGKARGNGTRTIYPQARPTWLAKSRKLKDPIPWNDPTDGSIWKLISQ